MPAGWVRGPRGGPTGPAEWVAGFVQDGNQPQPAGGEASDGARHLLCVVWEAPLRRQPLRRSQWREARGSSKREALRRECVHCLVRGSVPGSGGRRRGQEGGVCSLFGGVGKPLGHFKQGGACPLLQPSVRLASESLRSSCGPLCVTCIGSLPCPAGKELGPALSLGASMDLS